MQNTTALFQQLSDKLQQFEQGYAAHSQIPLAFKLDRTLFTEDYQCFPFYYVQIQQTLRNLMQLNEQELDRIQFLSERLLAQCTALDEAMQSTLRLTQKPQRQILPIQNKREQLKQALNQLPPRERLAKYYDALQTLNERITHFEDALQHATADSDKQHYSQQLMLTSQRKQRCLDAIETLEEYLEFASKQADVEK